MIDHGRLLEPMTHREMSLRGKPTVGIVLRSANLFTT
jgi:hypothetical protein